MRHMFKRDLKNSNHPNTGQVPQFPYYHGMDTTKLTARLKAKEEIIQQKTSQLTQLIKNLRKNYR